MTKGVTDETVDGMSIAKIDQIIDRLKKETYRFAPVRRVYIKKKGSKKQRPLGLPTWSDKLLQEVIRLILNIYFDPQFSDTSHGFRSNRGCHTALDAIRAKAGWKSVKWFIEGDIRDCFGSIDHGVLLGILAEKVKDNRFLRLMKQFLECGYLEDWKYNATLSGCPQGGILSPLLSNIYMDKFDQYMEKNILPAYNRGGRRAENKTYKALGQQMEKYKRHQDWKTVKELHKQRQSIPSKDTNDPAFRRLYYIRYADDWLLGFSGSKQETVKIKDEIRTFLATELKLTLSEEKTLITHAKTEKARFLGYDIHVLQQDTKQDRRGQRSINGVIGFRIPDEKMKDKARQYKKSGKPTHRKERTVKSDFDIIAQYQSEFRGFAQYYLLAYNAHQLHGLKRTMELSLARTLANKFKTTVNKIFKSYKTTRETDGQSYKVLQTEVKREDKKPLVAYFGGFKLGYKKDAVIVDELPTGKVFSIKSQLIDRLMKDTCELCGSSGNIEMHHVKKLKDLENNGRKEKPEWMKRMMAMRRKTLAVCLECHTKIHSGNYDGKRVTNATVS
ncbi:reverse transcriptase/maturase family protein [Desulfitobacterium sp.]|uniref:reverse transcriptase/maturase family protein n=1 Tax=Desulfitobacterium sp. TaxID=49981 RepID=UPI002D7E3C60|nr:reverse transcriptase domain-containing protein [Desulfitobacterium sp.]